MDQYYHIKDGIPSRTHGDLVLFINELIVKFGLNQALVIGLLTYKAVDFKEQLTLYMAAHGIKDTTTATQIEIKIRYMYKVDANDVEREINTTNNPGLAAKLCFVVKNMTRIYHKAEIAVENDVTPGNIIVTLLAVEDAYNYILECTQISEDGSPNIITTRTMTNVYAVLDGFVSGAKYSFRAQAVLANNTLVKFTNSVILRVN